MPTEYSHDAEGNEIQPGKAHPIRMIGGPFNGEILQRHGGVWLEVFNPDYEKWGPTERLAYAFKITDDNELVAEFPAVRDTAQSEG